MYRYLAYVVVVIVVNFSFIFFSIPIGIANYTNLSSSQYEQSEFSYEESKCGG